LNGLNVFGIAIGLAMDAFAVSIAVSLILKRITPRHVFRIAFHFGLFQFMMPIVGYLAGSTLTGYVEAFDHWLAFGLLAAIGGKMLFDAWVRDADSDLDSDPTRGWMLVTLSLATSIDALAVGLSLAFAKVDILYPSIVIGLVAGALSTLGIACGSRFLFRWGRGAEILGGIILIIIGIRVLVTHLLA
jgi:putative Mn2+ efflux pump MntP